MKAREDFFPLGFAFSFLGHILLVLIMIFGGALNVGGFQPPVIYSVTLEGGKTLGGMSQVAKENAKSQQAPPKNVSEKKKSEEKKDTVVEDKKTEEKKVEDAEVSLQEKKKEEEEKKRKEEESKKKKEEEEKKKKAEAKATAVPKPKDQSSQVNKNYQAAMQRYLGESTDAGGKGFGAGRVGGTGMGGGQLRPPEFFIYKKILEEHIKAGWRWHNTSMALVSQVIIDIEADGVIRSVTLEQGSGNSEFDESVVRAVKKSSPVPRPPANVYQWFKSVRMTFDPRE